MNYMALNIRGIGEQHKRKWVRDLRSQNKINMLCLQETQLGSSSSACMDVKSCWGGSDCAFEIIEATGRSGGLLTVWDENIFKLSDVSKGRHFLAVFGKLQGVAKEVAIVNVYAPQPPSEKSKLWKDLTQLKSSREANWIFLGDFNAVRRPDERINSRFCPMIANEFNKFIWENELTDLQMGSINSRSFAN